MSPGPRQAAGSSPRRCGGGSARHGRPAAQTTPSCWCPPVRAVRYPRRTIVTTTTVRATEHEVNVGAPAERVYALIADVGRWPEIFPPTVHAQCVEKNGNSELIKIWATANGTAKTWTSRRQHDPERMSVSFRQERSQHPVGGMGGTWVVEHVSES